MKKPWEGAFKSATDRGVEEFSASIHYDCRLAEEDIEGSLAHVAALAEAGIISAQEAEKISDGLANIKENLISREIIFDPSFEDIHMYIESLLRERIGEIGGKLHTGRSRNDQVALDTHLYMLKEVKEVDALLEGLQAVILEMAKANLGVMMPGYTHLQRAQPVLFSHHIMAYFWMFLRDRMRLKSVFEGASLMPLGAGALAGSGFELNREEVARRLSFKGLYENSMDAVSDRDYMLEFLAFASICMVHLSRMGEEIILWASAEFNFIEIDDAFTTGSSLMPQKKNPDVAELVRGKAGRVFGHLTALLTTMKGLPLCYNRDMQEDKEGVFDTIDTLKPSLLLFKKMLSTTKVNKEYTEAATEDDFALATDVADYLVYQGVPFRDSHHIVGKMVGYCREKNKKIKDLNQEELYSFHQTFHKNEIKKRLDPRFSIESRSIRGGTATKAVKFQIEQAVKAMSEIMGSN